MFVNKEVEIFDYEDESFILQSYSSRGGNHKWHHISKEEQYDISFGSGCSKDRRQGKFIHIVARRYGIRWNIFIMGQTKMSRVQLRYDRDKACVRENKLPMNINDYIKDMIFKHMCNHRNVFFECLDCSWETSHQIGRVQLQQELQTLIGSS